MYSISSLITLQTFFDLQLRSIKTMWYNKSSSHLSEIKNTSTSMKKQTKEVLHDILSSLLFKNQLLQKVYVQSLIHTQRSKSDTIRYFGANDWRCLHCFAPPPSPPRLSCSFMTQRMRALSARWNIFCTRYLYSSTKSNNEKHDKSSSITYEKVKNITWYVHITVDRDLKHIILYEPADKRDPPLDNIHLTLQHRNVRST